MFNCQLIYTYVEYQSRRDTIGERLALVRERRYGSRGKSSFARDLGIGPSTYDRYERDRPPPAGLLARIAKLTGTRLEWLVTGEGPQEEVPAEETSQAAAVLRRLRILLHRRPQLTGSIESFLDALSGSVEPPQPVIRPPSPVSGDMIPVVGSTAAGMARFWEELETVCVGPAADARLEQVLGEYEQESATATGALRAAGAAQSQPVSLVQLSRPGAGGFLEFLTGTIVRDRYPQAVAWRIDGDSMSPRYEDGDFVITSAAEPAVAGHPCVARQRGQIGVNCKLFQRQANEIILVPVNERYAAQRFPADQLKWAQRVLYSVRLQ
ncbi:MAG: LexA family transcriptional regulator [Planctomycetaceae bacterium]